MNAKAIGGGAVVLLGIGGFLIYNEISERNQRKRLEAEIAASYDADEQKKKEAAERGKVTWVTSPKLHGMTEDDARKALVAAGFKDPTIEVRDVNYECLYEGTVDGQEDMLAVGAICDQDPAPDVRLRAEKLKMKITIERDTWEHGGVGYIEWRRMPNLEGMDFTQAQALLASKGFGTDEFEIEKHPGGCAENTVCDTLPAAGHRKRKDSQGRIRASLK